MAHELSHETVIVSGISMFLQGFGGLLQRVQGLHSSDCSVLMAGV